MGGGKGITCNVAVWSAFPGKVDPKQSLGTRRRRRREAGAIAANDLVVRAGLESILRDRPYLVAVGSIPVEAALVKYVSIIT